MNKSKITIVASIILSTLLIAVSSISFAAQPADDTTTSKDVKSETKEAIETIKNYSIEQKDEAVKEVGTALDDLDARIDQMQTRVENKWDKMDQASRDKYNATLRTLRKKRNELSEWYGGMKQSSANAWDHVKDGFVNGYEAMAKAFDEAESEFDADGS